MQLLKYRNFFLTDMATSNWIMSNLIRTDNMDTFCLQISQTCDTIIQRWPNITVNSGNIILGAFTDSTEENNIILDLSSFDFSPNFYTSFLQKYF